ncbi:hypothetical protein HY495_00630 [Candidatus Woesearchaeota archaeon]|nr:hypothetical protein [Candidatus Woesearchaeota archaeon]
MDLTQTNSELERKINELRDLPKTWSAKDRDNLEQARRIAVELNTVLHTAIHHFVPDVNAVQIVLEPQAQDDIISMVRREIYFNLNRHDWESYVKSRFPLAPPEPFVFNAHLPFNFTTGTHGSGERDAIGASHTTVSCSVLANLPDLCPVLQLNLESSDYAAIKTPYFLIGDEVKSVRLVSIDDRDFSPLYGGFSSDLGKRSALSHYLFFKGFSRTLINGNLIPDCEWKEEVVNIMRNVSYLSTTSFTDFYQNNRWSGFAALQEPQGITLYDVNDLALPSELVGVDLGIQKSLVCAAYAVFLQRQGNASEEITAYSGKKAIGILSPVETKRRF